MSIEKYSMESFHKIAAQRMHHFDGSWSNNMLDIIIYRALGNDVLLYSIFKWGYSS